MRVMRRFLRDTQGATAVEYGLILGIICMIMIIGFSMFTDALTNMFAYIQTKIEKPVP
jgi:pilus assembly protein Flp/PilA